MTCPDDDVLLRLALGELSVNESRALEAHLATCSCAERHAAVRQLMADLSAGPTPRETDDDPFIARVVARASALPQERVPAARSRRPVLLTAVAAAVFLVPVVWTLRSAPEPDAVASLGTVTARGGPVARTVAATVLVARGERLLPVEGRALGPADTLAVRVTNVCGRTLHLVAFARDAAGEVHWIYPAYEDERTNPSSVAIDSGVRDRLMAEVVQLEHPASGTLSIVTVMSPASLSVKEVERRLEGQPIGADLRAQFPGAIVEVRTAEWRAP